MSAFRVRGKQRLDPVLAALSASGAPAAHAGDSVESLLHRGDWAMYAAKRRAASAAGSP